MPERISAGLAGFFQTHNAELFKLLQIDPFPGWSLPGSHKDEIGKFSTLFSTEVPKAKDTVLSPFGAYALP